MNGKAVGSAVAVLVALLGIAGTLTLSGRWIGATETKLEKHEELPAHSQAGAELQQLKINEAVTKERLRAIDDKLGDLKANQKERFDRIERILTGPYEER